MFAGVWEETHTRRKYVIAKDNNNILRLFDGSNNPLDVNLIDNYDNTVVINDRFNKKTLKEGKFVKNGLGIIWTDKNKNTIIWHRVA
jgi:hypothetical protein